MSDPFTTPPLNTFSIVAVDPEAGEIGLAVASRAFDAGYYCTFLRAGVGGVATQSFVNPHLGVWILDSLESGRTPADALAAALERDELAPRRQVGVIDTQGRSAAYTGDENGEWAGHLTASNVSVQGNLLAGPAVVEAMLSAYQVSDGPLADRLMLALEAGEAAGGDKRGKQSAALTVIRERGGYDGVDDRLVELKLTDHEEPIPELRRLFDLWRFGVITNAYARLASEEPDQAERLYGQIHRYLQQALDQKLDNAGLYNDLAWFMAEKKLFPEDTILAAQRAFELDPEDENILDTMAEAYFAAGQVGKAILWAEQALQISPDSEYLQGQLTRFKGQP